MPEVEGIDDLSEERIQDSFVHALAKTDYMASVDEAVVWPKYVAGEHQATIVSENEDPSTGAVIFNLSNGIKVYFKSLEGSGDTISFKAASKGGLSVVRENLGADLKLYISDIANLSAVGGIARSTWEKLYTN